MTERREPPRRRTGLRAGPWATALALLAVLAGCHTPKGQDLAAVSAKVESRFGQPVGSGECIVPDGLADGRPLTEDQAVLLALWNNALFREQLVELSLTRADLVQAGLLPNPEFVYYWPAQNKPFKYLIDFPIEALWLRPLRLGVAGAENDRAADRLAQLALDLIRDTRQAYADWQLAHDRSNVARRSVELRRRVADLAEVRFKAGDAGPLEVSTARIDALQAEQDAARAGLEVPVFEERLKNLMGLPTLTTPLTPDTAAFDPRSEFPPEELVNEAVRTRPDAAAADHAARAAEERLRVARLSWVRFLGLLDATSGRVTGHEFSPALRMTVPIFNRNQGGIARAEAELEQLDRRRQTVHNQVVLDVRSSYARYRQARAELDLLRGKTRPTVEAAIRQAETAYKEGNVTYLIVLETNRQLIDTYVREAQLNADLRRAWAELERAVGRRLGEPRP